MNGKFTVTILIALLLIIGSLSLVSSAEISFTDTSGSQVTLPAHAERVVCLNSDAAEAMVVLGAGDTVVGFTDSILSDKTLLAHLPSAVSVGDWQAPSIEKVIQLKPDAIIAYSSSKPKNADQFSSAGVKLIYLDCYKFDTLDHDIRALGTMIGAEKKADSYSSFLKKWTEKVTSRVANGTGEKMPSAYVEGYSDYSAQGIGSGADFLMHIAKGKNLAADLLEQWPKVTPEWIVKEDPAVIIKTASMKPGTNLGEVRDAILSRTGFETLSAVKSGKVYVISGDLIYGPRSPVGLVYLAKALHPVECADLNLKEVLGEYATEFVGGTETGDYYSPAL
jgi:iron complex transport system substrate-binding protein